MRASHEAIEAGADEVITDETSRRVKQGLWHGVYLTDVVAG